MIGHQKADLQKRVVEALMSIIEDAALLDADRIAAARVLLEMGVLK